MHLLLFIVITWVAIYAIIINDWKTVSLMIMLAVATMFLAGSKKR